jgi:hypothetical protein
LVWPPVEGRIVLREAMTSPSPLQLQQQGESWFAFEGVFQIHSSSDAVFLDVDAGRAELIAWARLHAAAQALLSRRRCLVLAETGDGKSRLWQIVRKESSLRDLLGDGDEDAQDVARRLANASRLLAEAQALCANRALPLCCTLDTIGVSELNQPVYVGLVGAATPETQPRISAEAVAKDLAALVRDRSLDQQAKVRDALSRVHRKEFGPERGAHIGELLTELLAP